jgi:hypothetical protein
LGAIGLIELSGTPKPTPQVSLPSP